ncbi:MAG: hypothetical protein LAP40_27330 [Acidobacteriia bacterium]|nr:hypothetical protein [Terriglobia bacterium]
MQPVPRSSQITGYDGMNARRLLIASILVNAALYSVLLPLWEGFDEPFHFAYVQQLANGQGLPDARTARLSDEVGTSLMFAPASPVVRQNIPQVTTYSQYFEWPAPRRLEAQRRLSEIPIPARWRLSPFPNYEAQHPPLAYLLLAAPERLLAALPLPLRVASLRVMAAVFGALLLFAGAVRLFTQFRIPASYQACALFCVFSCQMTWATLAHVGNDWLAVPLAIWTLVALNAYAARPSVRGGAGAAAVLAAGLLTKAYCLAFLPWFAGVFVWRRQGRAMGAAALVLGGLAGPWYVRNLALYGVLTGTQEARAGLTLAQVLRATPDLRWPTVIASSIRSALWTGNNTFLPFSAGTLNLVALIVVTALLLWLWGHHATAEWIAFGYCVSFALALAYAAIVSHLDSRGGLPFVEPWYTQVLAAPVLGLALLGASRRPTVGRFAAASLVLLFGYVLASTYWLKLIPLYGGYEGRMSPSAVTQLYGHRLRELTGNLNTVALAPAAVIYSLAGLTLVLIAVQQMALIGHVFDREDTPGRGELTD